MRALTALAIVAALFVATGSTAVELPLRLNCGGRAYLSPDGVSYIGDIPYTPELGFGYEGGDVEEFFLTFAGTSLDDLYRSERIGTFAYRIDLPEGTYRVTLRLVSKVHHGPGIGIFGIRSDGEWIEEGIDLNARAPRGYAQDVRAWISTEGEPLVLEFVPTSGQAEIAGLEVESSPPTPSAPGAPWQLEAWATPGGIQLHWEPQQEPGIRFFEVFRAEAGGDAFEPQERFTNLAHFHWDPSVTPGASYRYRVVAVGPEGRRSQPTETTSLQARPVDDTTLPTFRLDIDEESLGWMYESVHSNRWSPAILTVPEGIRYAVEARFRGSVSRRLHKKSFKIRFDGDDSYYERDRLNLMGKFDDSLIRDVLTYRLFQRLGFHVPQTSFAHLVLNGRSYGVYSRVEQIDDEFLEARGMSEDGSLYEVEGGNMTALDDPQDYKRFYDKKTGDEDDVEEIIRLVELVDLTPDDEFPEAVWETLDVDGFLDWYAANVIVANRDVIKENQYLYQPPGGGRWEFLAWDNDLAFPSNRPEDFPIDMGTDGSEIPVPAGTNRLFTRILEVDGFRYLYARRLQQYMQDIFTPESVAEAVDSLFNSIRNDALRDWFKTTWEDNEAFLDEFDFIKSFVEPRREYLSRKLPDLGQPRFAGIVINEIYVHPEESWVELWNVGRDPIPTESLVLSDRPFPGGGWRLTVGEISPGGFYVVGLGTEGPFLDDTVPHQIRDGARSLSLFAGPDGIEIIDVAFWPPYLTAGSFARKVDGSGVWESGDLASPGQPNGFPGTLEDPVRLLAYPNPWQQDLTIRWFQSLPGESRLEVFDVQGRRVNVVAEVSRAAGWNSFVWDDPSNNIPSGVYFLRLSGPGSAVMRILHLK
jgi:spore coat protein H